MFAVRREQGEGENFLELNIFLATITTEFN